MNQREWAVYGYVKGFPRKPLFLFNILANSHKEARIEASQTFRQNTLSPMYTR